MRVKKNGLSTKILLGLNAYMSSQRTVHETIPNIWNGTVNGDLN